MDLKKKGIFINEHLLILEQSRNVEKEQIETPYD